MFSELSLFGQCQRIKEHQNTVRNQSETKKKTVEQTNPHLHWMDFENYIKTEIDTKGNITKIAFMHLAGKSIILPIYNPTEPYIRYCNFGFSAFYHLQFCLTQSFHYTLFHPMKESLRYSLDETDEAKL